MQAQELELQIQLCTNETFALHQPRVPGAALCGKLSVDKPDALQRLVALLSAVLAPRVHARQAESTFAEPNGSTGHQGQDQALPAPAWADAVPCLQKLFHALVQSTQRGGMGDASWELEVIGDLEQALELLAPVHARAGAAPAPVQHNEL
jgi:hypothetical protein